MYRRGKYIMSPIVWHGERWWLIKAIDKPKNFHTHVRYEYKQAAKMICVRADEGRIPDSYPHWMVESINRLWFGKGFELRHDLNNNAEELLTNDESVRIKRKRKKKKYNNNSHKCNRYH